MSLRNLALFFSVAVLLGSLATSCAELGLEGDQGSQEDEQQTDADNSDEYIGDIPVETVALFDGVTSLMDMTLTDENPTDGPDASEYPEGYPTGMSVEWTNDARTQYRITLTNFAPEADEEESTPSAANGSITLSWVWSEGDASGTFAANGSITMTGYTYSTCSLNNVAAVFATDPESGDWLAEEPESVEGAFVVDGRSYSFEDMIAASEQLSEQEEEEEEIPLLTITGVPPETMVDAPVGVLVFPSPLPEPIGPGSAIAVGATSIDNVNVGVDLYTPTTTGDGGATSVEPGETVWEPNPDESVHYTLVLLIDVDRNGEPDPGDYCFEETGISVEGIPAKDVTGAGAPWSFAVGAGIVEITNRPPMLAPPQSTSVTIVADSSYEFQVEVHDEDGDEVAIVEERSPEHGTLTIGEVTEQMATVVYTPNADFTGSDSFSLSATDGYDSNMEGAMEWQISVVQGDTHVALFEADNEEALDFGPMTGFFYDTSWTIIERIKFPADSDTRGIHAARAQLPDTEDGETFLEGDVWFGVDETDSQLQAVLYTADGTSDPQRLSYAPAGGIETDTWYTICLTFDHSANDLTFYVFHGDQESQAGDTLDAPIDDRENNNPLFFGGMDGSNVQGEGVLYREGDIVIGNQAWFRRKLSRSEVQQYEGLVNTEDSSLFFATRIDGDGITDASGNERDAISVNSPDFVQR